MEYIKEESGGGSQSVEWAGLDVFFSGTVGSSAAHIYGYAENAETGMYEFGIHNVLMSDTVGREEIFMPMIDGVASWIYSTSPASDKAVVVDNDQSQGITTQGNYIIQAEESTGNRLVFKVIDSQPAI